MQELLPTIQREEFKLENSCKDLYLLKYHLVNKNNCYIIRNQNPISLKQTDCCFEDVNLKMGQQRNCISVRCTAAATVGKRKRKYKENFTVKEEEDSCSVKPQYQGNKQQDRNSTITPSATTSYKKRRLMENLEHCHSIIKQSNEILLKSPIPQESSSDVDYYITPRCLDEEKSMKTVKYCNNEYDTSESYTVPSEHYSARYHIGLPHIFQEEVENVPSTTSNKDRVYFYVDAENDDDFSIESSEYNRKEISCKLTINGPQFPNDNFDTFSETPGVIKSTAMKQRQPPPLLFRPSGMASDSDDEDKQNNRIVQKDVGLERAYSSSDIRLLKQNERIISPYHYAMLNKKRIHSDFTSYSECTTETCQDSKARSTSCPPKIDTDRCLSYMLPQNVSNSSVKDITNDNVSSTAASGEPNLHQKTLLENVVTNMTEITGDLTEHSSTVPHLPPLHTPKRLKQEKNKEASKNYRDRKKRKFMEIIHKENEFKSKNNVLKTQIKNIEEDIAAFENDLAKKIDTKEKIKRQICTLLLRDINGDSRDVDVERTIMQRILEKITTKHGELVKQAFYEVWMSVSKNNKKNAS